MGKTQVVKIWVFPSFTRSFRDTIAPRGAKNYRGGRDKTPKGPGKNPAQKGPPAGPPVRPMSQKLFVVKS